MRRPHTGFVHKLRFWGKIALKPMDSIIHSPYNNNILSSYPYFKE